MCVCMCVCACVCVCVSTQMHACAHTLPQTHVSTQATQDAPYRCSMLCLSAADVDACDGRAAAELRRECADIVAATNTIEKLAGVSIIVRWSAVSGFLVTFDPARGSLQKRAAWLCSLLLLTLCCCCSSECDCITCGGQTFRGQRTHKHSQARVSRSRQRNAHHYRDSGECSRPSQNPPILTGNEMKGNERKGEQEGE